MNYLIPITARHASKAGATLNLCISRAHGRTSDEGEVVNLLRLAGVILQTKLANIGELPIRDNTEGSFSVVVEKIDLELPRIDCVYQNTICSNHIRYDKLSTYNMPTPNITKALG